MHETIISVVIITICLPLFAFWSVVTWRLMAEQRGTEGESKPNPPPFLTTVFA